MSDCFKRAVGNFLPYSDGSGYRATVRVEQSSPQEQPTISIDEIFQLPASEWPDLVAEIETMLKGFSLVPSPPNSEDAG
jgi:hypothetical protein